VTHVYKVPVGGFIVRIAQFQNAESKIRMRIHRTQRLPVVGENFICMRTTIVVPAQSGLDLRKCRESGWETEARCRVHLILCRAGEVNSLLRPRRSYRPITVTESHLRMP